MKKRLLAILLMLAMCLALLPATAFAADSDFTIVSGELREYNGPGGDVIIPDEVTSLSQYAFQDCANVTSMTIPNSLTSVNNFYFSDCTGLTDFFVDESHPYLTVRDGILFNKAGTSLCAYPMGRADASYAIPEGVTNIDGNAFYGCTNLTSVTIPEGVTRIWNGAFKGCTGLTSVVIPEGVTTLFGHAFYGCTGLTSVTIPHSVTNIELYAFYGCKNLTEVVIPEGVTYIGPAAFWNCEKLSHVTLPSTLTQVQGHPMDPWGIFYNCPKLKTAGPMGGGYDIEFGWTKKILSGVFDYSTLTSATLPVGVTEIEQSAFSGCTGLISLVIPASVTSIGSRPFSDCRKLMVYGQAGSYVEQYCLENGVPFEAGFPSGISQAGTLTSDSGEKLTWAMTRTGDFTVPAADLAPEEAVLVGCYDNTGKFAGVKWIDANSPEAKIDPATPNVKLFWLGANQNPLSSSVTVWGK